MLNYSVEKTNIEFSYAAAQPMEQVNYFKLSFAGSNESSSVYHLILVGKQQNLNIFACTFNTHSQSLLSIAEIAKCKVKRCLTGFIHSKQLSNQLTCLSVDN